MLIYQLHSVFITENPNNKTLNRRDLFSPTQVQKWAVQSWQAVPPEQS